jgi:hypothetical protein
MPVAAIPRSELPTSPPWLYHPLSAKAATSLYMNTDGRLSGANLCLYASVDREIAGARAKTCTFGRCGECGLSLIHKCHPVRTGTFARSCVRFRHPRPST